MYEFCMKFVPRCPINTIPALVQIMAWRLPGANPLSEPMVVSLLAHIYVTRPQWVKQQFNTLIDSFCVHWTLLFLDVDYTLLGRLKSVLCGYFLCPFRSKDSAVLILKKMYFKVIEYQISLQRNIYFPIKAIWYTLDVKDRSASRIILPIVETLNELNSMLNDVSM